MKESLRATKQQNTVQSANVDAMGYHLEEMKYLFLQRELRMELQMAALNMKIHTLSSPTHSNDQPTVEGPTTSDAKEVPVRTLDPPLILNSSPKTVTKTP